MSTVKVWLQHVNEEPAICFGRVRFMAKTAYVICLSSAYKFTDDDYLLKTAFKIAKQLGLEPVTQGEAIKIADTIMQSLDALISYKPETNEQIKMREKQEAFGRGYTAEGVLKINDEEIEFQA